MEDLKEIKPGELISLTQRTANELHQIGAVDGTEWGILFRSEDFGRAVVETAKSFLAKHTPSSVTQRQDPDRRSFMLTDRVLPGFPGNAVPDPLRL